MNIIKRTLFLIFFFTSIVFSATTSWKGTTSTSWNNSTNWTNGVPTSTLDVIIGDANFTGGNHPTLNVSGNCKSLIIGGANSATLTLSFNNKNLTVSGDITIQSNGTLLQSSKSTILLTGNWVNSGTFTASNNNAEVRFAGALQSLTGVTAFRKLTVNVGSTLTLHANISHTRTLSVSGTINPNESPTYTISGAGALTLQSGGKLLVKASTFVGNYNDGTKTFSSGSIVEYAASSTNQTVSNSFTYSTLQISGGMTKTLAGNLPSLSSATSTVGNIYVLSGTFDLSSFTANRGTTVVGGIFSVSNGAVVKIGGTNSFPQNYQTHSFGVTSTVEYSGGNQTVSNELYGNLTLSSSSGAVVKTMPTSSMSILGNLSSNVGSGTSVSYTAGEALSIGGSISIGTSTTFNASSYSHNISGNWTNNGTFTGNTSTVTLAGNSSTISGTGTNSFNHLIISGSNVTASSSTAINVAGNFSTSGAGTFLHTTGGSGLFTMSGTSKTISGSGISFSDLTISGTITTSSSYTVAGNLSVTNSLIASGGTTTLSGTSKTITNSGTLNLSVLSVTGTITTTSNFTLTSDLHVIGSLTATAGTATFAGVSGLSGTANLFNVVLNGTSLTLGTNSELGIAGSFTITSGTFDATSETPNTVNYNSSGAQSVIVASYYNLNVSNGGVKTPAGNLIIYGNLTIGAGTTLSGSSYTYTLYGHWNNGGTFSAGTSTVELVGGVDASIIGTTTFNILTVNKTSTLNILSVNNIVVSILNMTQGRLQTGNGYSITITNTRTGTGLIFGTVTRTHSFFTGVSYAFHSVNDLVTFNGGGTNPTSVTRTLELTSPVDMPVPELSINRTYTMTQTGGSGYTATVRFYYSEEDLNGNIESQLEAWHYDGASWSGIGKSAYDVTDNWLERDGLTDITNRWTLQSPLLGILDWNGSVSSAWEDPANWTVFSGIPSIPPTSTELVRIGFNAFTNNPTVNSAAQCRALRYGSAQGSVLSIQSGSLTTDGNSGEIAGTFTQDVTHTIEVNNNTLTCSGSMLLSNGTANRIINITLGSGTIYIQRKLDQLANASVTITGSGSIILAGDWNRTSGSFSAGTGTVTYNGSVDQLVATGITYNNLTFSKTGGIALFASSASVAGDLAISNNGKIQLNGDLDVDGDVTVGVGTILSSGSINLSVGGDWNLLGTFEPNLGSVIFDGTSDQSISSSSFNNLEIDKSSGTANLTGNITINSDLTVAAGSLELYSYNANRSVFGGTFTMGAGTTVRVGGANNFPSNFSTYTFNANSTSEYYGTVSQSVKDVTYGNLKFYNGTSNPKTLTGTTNVQGNLLINSGATFDGSSFALNLDGDWTNNGTFTPSSSIVTLQGTSKNLVGNTSFHELSVSGSYTGQNNITVSGDINISGSYTSGNTSTIFGGNFTNNGTFTNSSIVTFNGTSLQEISLNSGFNSSGTVYFNGTIAPTFAGLTSPTLNNVTINNTGGILAATDWTVGGVFTVNAGASFDGGSRSHTFSGDFMNDGTVSSNGTITFNPSGSVTVKLLGTSFTNNGTTVFGGSGFISITGGTPSLHDVTISNTNVAGVSQTTNWTLSGNVRINNGSTFYGGSALTLTVNQNVLNDGTFEGGTSTVVLNNSIEGNISGSGSSIFNNLTINGVIIAYQDFSVKKDFTNNGTFDGTGINISVIGSGSSIFGGTTTPTPVDHLIIQKTSSTATLAMDINEVTNLHVASGIFDIGSSIITQETVTGGAFQIDSSATAKIGGTNSLPTFNSYSFDTASTVEFNGNGSQTITHTPVYGNLTLSTGGTKSTTGALTMLENFNLSSATFTGGSYTHSLGGNWTMNSGTFTNTGTTINFNGTGTQTINSTGAFNNLTSNKSSGGITLASDVTVNGTLTFTSGNITTGTNKMIVGSTGTVSRTSGYVVGNLQKYISTGSPTMTFEIGDVSNYAPPSLAFSNVTSAGNVIASTTNGDHPQIASSGIDATKSVNRYWSLTNSGTTFTTSDATFNFVSGDVDAGADPNLFFGRIYDGSTWSAPTVGTRTATSTQLTGLTDFGDIQIGEGGNPVPTTTSISPSSKNSGDGAFTLTVNGTNFVAASVVRFNGSDRTTTFVSSSQLTATIPATDLITAGTYPITVFSPTPGGGTSNSQTFTVNSGTLDHFTLSAISSPQVAGIAFAFSMTAKDANNNTVTGFSGTVDISSTGTLITGGGTSASFTSGVLASHAVTISNTGNFTITATKTSGTETGTSNSFTVNPGSSSTVTSTITAAPISITANGTSTSTITVQLKDAYGNNLTTGGETVALSTTSGSLGSVTDNNNGTYTATLTSSTVVGTATITGTLNGSAITDDATVTFTVGSASTATSTITASPTSITANGISTSTITVQLKDVNGNNLTSGGATVALSTTSGSLGSVTDNSNGTYSATLTSSIVTGTATITGTLNGSAITDDATVMFTVGSASTVTSTITASPTSITANGTSTSTITVQLKDVNGNNLTTGGATVALSTTSGSLGSVTDNNNGTYTATLTSSIVAGTATITGTLNSNPITDDATVTFTVGSASTATSTITAAPTSITANGTSTSTITVQLKDVNGNNLTTGGATVALSTTSGSLGSVTDNNNGTYTATLTSSIVAGTATITGTLNGSAITDDATVTFTVGAASTATSTITASPTSITANGTSTSTITIQLKDVNGNNLTTGGETVALSTTSGSLGSVTDNSNGTFSATLTSSTVAGTATITGTLNGSAITDDATVTFTAGSVNNFLVESASGGSIGSQTAGSPFSIKITARDQFGNTATSFTGTVTISSTGTLSSGSGITASFTAGVLSSHSVTISNTGTFTITATNTAGSETGTSNSFTVNAGAVNNFLVESSAGGNIGTQTAGTSFAIKITARDAGNNTVTSFTGTVDISSTGTLSSGSGTTVAFTAGVLSSHSVTITNSGTFTITATKTGSSESGTSNSFVVNAATLDHFLVQSSSGGSISTQTAGTTFAIKVTAKDVFNNTVTAFTGTVDISSTGTLSMGGGTTAPFTSGVLSSHSVTISNTGSFTITATKTSGVEFGTSNSFTVSAGSVNNFVVEAFGGGNIGAQTAGVPFAITITAYDALGNVATGFTGTVNVTSTGTITAGSGTTLAFTAGVLASHSITISSVGTYTVTATRTGGAQNGVSNSFVVNPGLLSTFLVEKQGGGNIGSQRTNISFNIRLTAKDAFGNTIPTFTGTADISSTGTLSAGSGTTSAFVAGVLTSHTVAISNNGTFTITATATGSSESGTSNSFSVLGASVSGNAYNDANSNGVKDVGENGLSGWTINVTGTNPVNNQTVTTAAGGNYTISNLAADTYTIALQMQTNWSATVPVTATYTVAITNGIDTTGFTFGAVTAGSGTMMRTFTPQELGVKKAVKKKNVNTKFTFHFVNRTRQSVDGLSVEFNGSVSSIEVHTPFSIYYDTDQRGQDWEFRGTTIAPGETVTVTGYTNSKAMDAGKYWWTSGGQIIEWTKGFLRPTEKINLLPMPNMANVRDDVFARMGGILVGVARPDSKKVYGWVNLTKSADFQRSMYDKHEHYGPARGFTVYGKGPKVMGQLRNMPPSRYNNKLFAHVTALKFSIEASALQVTPAGLGELIYDEGTNPLSGLQLKEIVRKIDTALTYWRHRSPAEYINYDTTLGKILNAFSGSMDTTSWGDSLVLEGTRPISDVSFLRVNPNVPPVIKSRENVVTVEEETPEKFALNQNYPNPFNPVTNFGFRIADLGLVTLKVYDMLGREVATLIDKQETEEGEYEFQFDGSNLPSGVYAYRLTVESTNDEGVSRTFTDVKRMMLLK